MVARDILGREVLAMLLEQYQGEERVIDIVVGLCALQVIRATVPGATLDDRVGNQGHVIPQRYRPGFSQIVQQAVAYLRE